MPEREVQRRAFIAAQGWPDADVEALPADASSRRYFRLRHGWRSALVMDAPPERETVAPFLRLSAQLLDLGLSAPRVRAADIANGFVLLEDFGDATFTRLLAAGFAEAPLYALAVDALVHLHRQPRAVTAALPAYDEAALLAEVALFTDWYWPALRGQPCPAPARSAWLAAWRSVFATLPPLPATLVLRDYHVDNLMLLPERPGVAACGLLDFQDALLGSPAYDLVSLLEDARRDVAPALADAMRARYLQAFPALPAVRLDEACAVLGAQRHAKVAGIFVRLWRRDGKAGYLRHLPRVLALFSARLGHPLLAPVAQWLDEQGVADLDPDVR